MACSIVLRIDEETVAVRTNGQDANGRLGPKDAATSLTLARAQVALAEVLAGHGCWVEGLLHEDFTVVRILCEEGRIALCDDTAALVCSCTGIQHFSDLREAESGHGGESRLIGGSDWRQRKMSAAPSALRWAPSQYQQHPCYPCPPKPKPPDSPYKPWPSCLLPADCIEEGNCKGVMPPKAQEEIVIFRKVYTCCMKDHVKKCEKDCPYVRTIQYIVEPHWEQLVAENDCPPELITLLEALSPVPVPAHSELAHCLSCAYDKCFLENDECQPCQGPQEKVEEGENADGDGQTNDSVAGAA